MPNLNDFDQTVALFMRDFGGTASLLIQGNKVRNVETGTIDFEYVSYDVKAILLDLTLQSNGMTTINGTLIESGDKRAFIQPRNKSDPTLTMPVVRPNKDKFAMGGKVYTIITLKETDPSTTNNVMLELYLRA